MDTKFRFNFSEESETFTPGSLEKLNSRLKSCVSQVLTKSVIAGFTEYVRTYTKAGYTRKFISQKPL